LLPPNTKVLDAGCGGGRDTKLLQMVGTNATGLEWAHASLLHTLKR